MHPVSTRVGSISDRSSRVISLCFALAASIRSVAVINVTPHVCLGRIQQGVATYVPIRQGSERPVPAMDQARWLVESRAVRPACWSDHEILGDACFKVCSRRVRVVPV